MRLPCTIGRFGCGEWRHNVGEHTHVLPVDWLELPEGNPSMRNATILVIGLKGVATEAIKNMVLAGVGTLIMLDGDDVQEEDLGAGFFFTDKEVGQKVSI
jgi:molybdopterin/thiamine biosynthesis adenylyltransferase